MKKRIRHYIVATGVLVFTLGLATGCEKALNTASETFDSLVGDLISAGSNPYEEDGEVAVRILTSTPTPEPTLSPLPTMPPTATPTPKGMPPANTAVDEWVYATSSVNIRAGWSTDYLIVGGLSANDMVHRVAILENGWSKISYNSEYVYVNSAYLTTQAPSRIATIHMDTMQYMYNAVINSEDVAMLGVQNILQKPELPACPEITSLAIVLNYLGHSVNKRELAENYLVTAEPGTVSPMEAFWGDPKTAEGTYGCYAPVIINAANQYFAEKNIQMLALDVSGSTLDELFSYVKKGTPVIVWATTNMVPGKLGQTWEINGETLQWHSYEHCMVLIGYNKTTGTVIMADPLRGIVEYDSETFFTRYQDQYESAMIISNK